jgi:hypothetical protein
LSTNSDSPKLSDPEYGGVVAVCAGLVALSVIAIVAIVVAHDSSSSVASIATGAGGVIGSVVGAPLGVKSGSNNAMKALEAQQNESARAQIFAASADRPMSLPRKLAYSMRASRGDRAGQ